MITHATTEKARFLGYDLQRFSSNTKLDHLKRRSVNGKLCLYIPREVSEDRCKRYMVDGKPVKRPELIRDSDFDIVSLYGAEFRGFVQYYLLAHNVYSLNKLQWVMETSLLKTLANKYKSRVTRMARKYKSKTNTPEGPRKCFKVIIPREDKKPLIARFGGIPLIRKERATIKDVTAQVAAHHSRSELIQRMMANECELCGSHKNIQIHHIRKLADLDKPGRNRKPKWMKIMSARKRKTLAVCRDCHYKIHQGEPTTRKD